ncbi:MAG: proline--tRNA ligase [Planctomycetes bacterium]|nr:proline--tRNA ligase [Planctomycetota bacterium]
MTPLDVPPGKGERVAKITKRSDDYSQWYIDLVTRAEMADYAPVKGCMVIRPWGYAIWERMQRALDDMFKATGHSNAYFPLLIPQSFLQKEAEHVEGFAPECAVVTRGGGKELEEPLVIRPTSETIIWAMYKKWIQSWRDLPLLYNQWANVVRWEMRTRLFLRTTEFLWQEGHTAHATAAEAMEEAQRILGIYRIFAEQWMAMPVLSGAKSDAEKFAGAVTTYAIEALMQDGKALQAGTSHYLGQNFAKAFDVQFQNREGQLDYVFATSWGVSTRLVGALVMSHSDDAGLVLPPKLAPIEVVIVPILKSGADNGAILTAAARVAEPFGDTVRVKLDDRDNVSPGWKFNEWELKGVPVRIEIGPKDLEKGQVILARRDTGEKTALPQGEAIARVPGLLEEIQESLFARAKERLAEGCRSADSYEEFQRTIDEHGGFVSAPWCGRPECEARVSEETKATIRLLPEDAQECPACMVCGQGPARRVPFARAY